MNLQTDEQKSNFSYILGCYLGDGYIKSVTRNGKKYVHRLIITGDEKYPGIIAEQVRSLNSLFSDRVASTSNQKTKCIDVSLCFSKWPDYLPHGVGKKHNRSITLNDWQKTIVDEHPKQFIKGLFHTDGSRYVWNCRGKYTYVRYSFANRSEDVFNLLISAMAKIKLYPTTTFSKNDKCHILTISRKQDIETLDLFIGPKQ